MSAYSPVAELAEVDLPVSILITLFEFLLRIAHVYSPALKHGHSLQELLVVNIAVIVLVDDVKGNVELVVLPDIEDKVTEFTLSNVEVSILVLRLYHILRFCECLY